jgi:hypothetical protein
MRRILCALLVGVMTVFLSAQAQILSTHEIVRMLSAQGDVTAADLQPALGQWQLELYNLPNRTDFFSAQYLVDADENGKFEVGLDPVYEITGQPKLVTAHVKVFCGSPLKSRATASPKGGSKRALFSFWRRETCAARGLWCSP